MDLPWFENPPGYQFLHCLINNAEGGDSSAVDGFAVADYLRKNEKETFDTCLLYTSPSPRDVEESRMPSSA